ncbi:MAG TPA: hypothetical protein VGE51_06335 [Fontimonas sp.]
MRRHLLLVSMLAFAPHAQASDFDIDCATACQAAFEDVVTDISAALNYKALGPAEATGLLGFGVGAFVSYVPVQNEQAWRTLTGSDVDAVAMAGLSAHKGLPFGIDIGAFYTAVPGTDAKAYGAELRYAILEGGIAQPALALRGAYTATSGIDDFDYDAYSADVSLSKGFTFVTPYIGAGYVWATATPSGSVTGAPLNLEEVEVDNERFFVGMRITAVLLEITPEYERVGDNNAYNLRLGFSF